MRARAGERSEQGLNRSVEKAAAVLSAFADVSAELRVSDVAEHVGLGQSTASRLLATLEALDYVERDPISNLYHLGPALITLAGVAMNHDAVYRESRQRVQDLACAIGLGVNVAVRRGSSLFYLCNVEGRLAPKSVLLMGQYNPLHATGIGKCLLLDLDHEERRHLLPELVAFTSRTITSHDVLDAVLDDVREKGYATEIEELALGRACVAAPILDRSRRVVAGLSISGPLTAISVEGREKELAQTVIEVADWISVGLGYVGPTQL